jgi:hypothetical protein
MHTLREFLKLVGGNIGQRERVLYTTWGLTFFWGVLNHYSFSSGESALTILLGASGGVIASYTYRTSAAAQSGPSSPDVRIQVPSSGPSSSTPASPPSDPPTDPGGR